MVTDVHIPRHVAPEQIFTSICCVKTTDEKMLQLPTTGCMMWMLSVDLLGLVTSVLWCKTATIVQPTVQLYDMCTSVFILSHKQTIHVTQKCSVESSYSY